MWLLWGGPVWLLQGGMRGCSEGHAWLLRGGACVVAPGGHAWLLWGGMRGFIRGRAWFYSGGHAWFYSGGVHGFFSFFGYNEIRSMSGRYASYWNAFLCYQKEKGCLLFTVVGFMIQ